MREITFHLTDTSAATAAEGPATATPRASKATGWCTVSGDSSSILCATGGTVINVCADWNPDSGDRTGVGSVQLELLHDCAAAVLVTVKAGVRVLGQFTLISLLDGLEVALLGTEAAGTFDVTGGVDGVSCAERFEAAEPLSVLVEQTGATGIEVNKLTIIVRIVEDPYSS